MSNKDYNAMYQDKLKKLKESVLGSSINDQLELKAISNRKIEQITDAMKEVVGKKVWEDFNFRTGKILGILRFIAQNPIHRQQLLEVTGLTQDYVDIYFKVCGNLPYLNTTDNTLNPGRHMDVEATKEFIKIVAAKFDLLVEDDDVSDITEERWQRLYNNALERITKTIEHNEQHGDSVPQQYDE